LIFSRTLMVKAPERSATECSRCRPRRDHPLERRGDEAAHELGAGADVNGGDRDHGVVAARVLAHVDRTDACTRDDDQQVHHQRRTGGG